MSEVSIVRTNLLSQPGYSPYCGSEKCYRRTKFNGNQFECKCGWKSAFPSEFIAEYKIVLEKQKLNG